MFAVTLCCKRLTYENNDQPRNTACAAIHRARRVFVARRRAKSSTRAQPIRLSTSGSKAVVKRYISPHLVQQSSILIFPQGTKAPRPTHSPFACAERFDILLRDIPVHAAAEHSTARTGPCIAGHPSFRFSRRRSSPPAPRSLPLADALPAPTNASSVRDACGTASSQARAASMSIESSHEDFNHHLLLCLDEGHDRRIRYTLCASERNQPHEISTLRSCVPDNA